MDIVYLTDIHDNLKRLRHVILNTRADLYIISGDLIYKAFFTEEKLYDFVSLQEEFYNYLVKENIRGTPSELARSIARNPGHYPAHFQPKAKIYDKLFQKASSNMKDKYQILKDLVDKYAKARLIFIPGNYDMDLQFTALYTYDLHKKCALIDDIKFCGYGGAPIATSGIPEMVSVVFYEYIVGTKLHSEPKEFFDDSRPDVMVLHNPPYGALDKLASFGRVGSHGLREHIDTHQPAVVLSGHVHSDYGLMRVNNTFCINPSNFGHVETMDGTEHGGYFCRLKLQKKEGVRLEEMILYRLIDKEIMPILKAEIAPDLSIEEKIYNEKEHERLGGFIR